MSLRKNGPCPRPDPSPLRSRGEVQRRRVVDGDGPDAGDAGQGAGAGHGPAAGMRQPPPAARNGDATNPHHHFDPLRSRRHAEPRGV